MLIIALLIHAAHLAPFCPLPPSQKVDIEGLVRGVLLEMRTDQLLIGEPTFHVSSAGKLMTCIFPCDVEDAHLVLTR